MSKVLVVTDYAGGLHITPLGNKNYYVKQNKLIKTKQFGLQEMEEDVAQKFVEDNKGIDPKYVPATDSRKVIADKDAQIEALQKQVAALQVDTSSVTAKDLIEKIKAATTVEEVKGLAGGDTRATVIAAAAAQIEALQKQ